MPFRSRRTRNPPDQKLGARSPLVLAKLGYDLREQYGPLLDAPLPEEIERSVEQLTRKDGTVVELPGPDSRDPGDPRRD